MTKSQMFVVDNHPVIPPGDLLKKWEDKWFDEEEHADVLLIQAYQAGADEELEACLTEVSFLGSRSLADKIRSSRRPKPPSLKEQALRDLESLLADLNNIGVGFNSTNIRRALEQLDA